MKLRALILYAVIPVLLLSAWNNAFAVEPTPTVASGATAADQEKNKQENAEVNNDRKKLNDVNLWYFVVGCGVISILVKVVDYTMQTDAIENKKELGKFFSEWPLSLWLGWFFSAAIVGLLANLVGLFQASAVTAVTIGLGWPTVFAQLKEKYGSNVVAVAKTKVAVAEAKVAVAEAEAKVAAAKAEEAKQNKDVNKNPGTPP